MNRCKHLEECAFYNNRIIDLREAGELIKQHYCIDHPEKCKRIENSKYHEVSDEGFYIAPWGSRLM